MAIYCRVLETPWILALAQKYTQQETKNQNMRGFRGELMEGEFGSQGRQRDPQWSNLPGSDRDLGTGQGRKRRGGVTDMGNGVRRRHTAQVAETSGGRWHVASTGDVQVGGALLRERM